MNQRLAYVDPHGTWGFHGDIANPVWFPAIHMSIHSKRSCRLWPTENYSIVVIPNHDFTDKRSNNIFKHITRTMNFLLYGCNVPGMFLSIGCITKIVYKNRLAVVLRPGVLCDRAVRSFLRRTTHKRGPSVRSSGRLDILADTISSVRLSIRRCFVHYSKKAYKAWHEIMHANVYWPSSELIGLSSMSTGFPSLGTI